MNNLTALLERLCRGNVDFVIVGGFAAVAHGVGILTHDLDVCCRFTEENLLRLQGALADLHPVFRMTSKRLPLDVRRGALNDFRNIYLDTDLGQLDCLSSVTGVGDFQEVLKSSIEISLAFGRCRILSLDALIRAKEALNLDKDRRMLLQLRALREKGES